MKYYLLSILCLVSLTSAIPVLAEDPDPFDKHLIPLEAVMSFRRQIDLTREQSDAIGKLVVDVQKSVAEKQWQMQSTYFELIEQLEASEIDEEETLRLVRSAVDTENDIKVEQVRLLIRLRNLLNQKQIDFLKRKIADGWSKP